ncbi:MAG: 50S ribosomal protein L6 [Gemmatimonadetes bacterium]|nr:50S ribosomal protein L6 [Gemmatimonadota bacterium]
MSRIGKLPIAVPKGVEVRQEDGTLSVKGPKGDLSMNVPGDMQITVEGDTIHVTRPSDQRHHKALHGLTRTLAANMVTGVTEGFKKTLSIVGVGYRAEKKGSGITLHLGYSHPINYEPPEGVQLDVPQPTTIVVHSADKQKVGQVAADIRGFRPPEPYKGKGVRYENEQVRRKAGKTAGS